MLSGFHYLRLLSIRAIGNNIPYFAPWTTPLSSVFCAPKTRTHDIRLALQQVYAHAQTHSHTTRKYIHTYTNTRKYTHTNTRKYTTHILAHGRSLWSWSLRSAHRDVWGTRIHVGERSQLNRSRSIRESQQNHRLIIPHEQHVFITSSSLWSRERHCSFIQYTRTGIYIIYTYSHKYKVDESNITKLYVLPFHCVHRAAE